MYDELRDKAAAKVPGVELVYTQHRILPFRENALESHECD
jgi:hypothetical protein